MVLVIRDEAVVSQKATGVVSGQDLKERIVVRGQGIDGKPIPVL